MLLISTLFSAAWQWLLGKFGLSDAQRSAMQAKQLGQALEQNKQLEQTLETVRQSHEEDIINAHRGDSDLRMLTRKFNRDKNRGA